jgi:uncharacterized protein (TIGR02594 family)
MASKAYELALSEVGTVEWADGSNPKVVKYFADSGHPEVSDDATAWCAAFVGAMLKRAGYEGTGSLAARSYLKWGEPVEIGDAQAGDIAVIRRGTSAWQGHVFFVHKVDEKKIWGVGGNQKDSVNISGYSREGILGIRRPKGGWSEAERPAASRDRSSPIKSTTVQATAIQMASGAGAGVAAVGALDGYAQIIAVSLAAVVILAALWIMRERLKRWADGDR